MSTDAIIARGKRAAEILDDPLVVEALDALDAFVIDGFRGSKLGERDEREALYHLNVAIADFRAHFRSLVSDGTMAQGRLAQDAEREG
jgi:hypothetical protein